MLYDEARMALTKERLEDLRKEKKLSFEQLSKQLAERGVNISHTNLKNYEINDPVHPLYGRTRSMSIEYLVAFADFYDVSVEYLLGLSNSRKQEYHNISEQLGLCDGAIEELIRCKEDSNSEEDPKIYAQQDTAILNDFLTSMEFEIVMEKIKQSLFSYYLYALSSDDIGVLDSDDIRIDLFVSRLEGGDFLAVFLTLLTQLDYFRVHITSLRAWQPPER